MSRPQPQIKLKRRPTMLQKNYIEEQKKWDAAVSSSSIDMLIDRIEHYRTKEEPWQPRVNGTDYLLEMPLPNDGTWDCFGYNPYCEECNLLTENPFVLERTCFNCFFKS
jgi:hypothetical protein